MSKTQRFIQRALSEDTYFDYLCLGMVALGVVAFVVSITLGAVNV